MRKLSSKSFAETDINEPVIIFFRKPWPAPKDCIVFLVTRTGDSPLSPEVPERISWRTVRASKYADQNSMQNKAFILFLLGISYQGSRKTITTKNKQNNKGKRKGVLFLQINVNNQDSIVHSEKYIL